MTNNALKGLNFTNRLNISIRIRNRNPFGISNIPFLLKPYAIIADPFFQKILSKFKMIRLANAFWKILFQIGKNKKGVFSFTDKNQKTHNISFRAGNSQFIAIYLNYFCKYGYEPEVMSLLDTLSDGQTIFYDIGANWGFHAIYLASKPNFRGKIFAFEPVPETYADLCSVVLQAGLSESIECVNFALSNKSGSRFMEYPGFLKSLSGMAKFSNINRGFVVKTSTLDHLKATNPDLIKLDVEGAEIEVLLGGQEMILRSKPMIIFENFFSAEDNASLETFRVLKEFGYRFFQPMILRSEDDWISEANADHPLSRDQQNWLGLCEFKLEERPQMTGSNFLACHHDRVSKLRTLGSNYK